MQKSTMRTDIDEAGVRPTSTGTVKGLPGTMQGFTSRASIPATASDEHLHTDTIDPGRTPLQAKPYPALAATSGTDEDDEPSEEEKTRAIEYAKSNYTQGDDIVMSVAEWSAIKGNPRQRNTLKRAKTSKHLHVYEPLHRNVSIGILPDGTRLMLDAHTRKHLWTTGTVEGPATVKVQVFHCKDELTAIGLYYKFDNKDAVENASDRVMGVARHHNIEFETGFLRDGRYGTAIKRLYTHLTKRYAEWQKNELLFEGTGYYRDALIALDDISANTTTFPSGIIMAMLATHKRHGERVMPFWRAYARQEGTKDGSTMDGVQALREAVMSVKSNRKATGGQGQQMGLVDKGIIAAEGYMANRKFKTSGGRGVKVGLGSMTEAEVRDYIRHGYAA